MSTKTTINLLEHPDFRVSPGVRGKIVWHGQTYDTKSILLEVAERMAREPETRYVQFSDQRLAREAEARVKQVLPEKAIPPATVTADVSTSASSIGRQRGRNSSSSKETSDNAAKS